MSNYRYRITLPEESISITETDLWECLQKISHYRYRFSLGFQLVSTTNFRGWRRVWGELRGNRGRPKEPGENRGHLGREPGENRGLLLFIYKDYRGRSGGFGTRTGAEPGGGNFLWNRRPNSGPENQRTGPPVKISSFHHRYRFQARNKLIL